MTRLVLAGLLLALSVLLGIASACVPALWFRYHDTIPLPFLLLCIFGPMVPFGAALVNVYFAIERDS